MCIGLPLQVLALAPGHALCDDPGQPGTLRRVRTVLLGDDPALQPGAWLLVFIDSAVELLSDERAAEIRHTLALLAGVMQPQAAAEPTDPLADPGFDLPSRWTTEQLRALSGQAPVPEPEITP